MLATFTRYSLKNSRIFRQKLKIQAKISQTLKFTANSIPKNRPKKTGVVISLHKLLLILYSAESLGFLKIKEITIFFMALSGIQSSVSI